MSDSKKVVDDAALAADAAKLSLGGVAASSTSAAAASGGAGASEDDGAARPENELDAILEANEMLKAINKPGLEAAISAVKGGSTEAASTPLSGGGGATETPVATPSTAAAAVAHGEKAHGGAGAEAGAASSKDALLGSLFGRGVSKSKAAGGAGESKEYKFWSTQPVPKLGEKVEYQGPIDEPKTVADVRPDPLPLPAGYEWVVIDVTVEKELTEFYELLRDNYVEDDDSGFRFNYTANFLKWALTPPGYYKDWHVGLRSKKTGRLVACITGVPAHMRVYDHELHPLCEINFLCVLKKLRSLRLAPVLIKEVTRRVNLCNIWQAAYTAGVMLPKPVTSCQYWHRSINPKKLIDTGFSRLAPRMTLARTIRLYHLDDTPKIDGLRPLEAKDIPAACKMLNDYLTANFSMHPVFSEAEFAHVFTPIDGVVNAYVVEDPDTHLLTDMLSFYHIPSTIIGNDKHKVLYAAYSFYNVPGKHTIEDIMAAALVLAKKCGVDVFNALDLQENSKVVKELKFGPGDGHLQYYLFNWACPEMKPEKMGLVLL